MQSISHEMSIGAQAMAPISTADGDGRERSRAWPLAAARDNVVKVLVTSGLSDTSVTSAALRALLDVLEHGRIVVADGGNRRLANGMSRHEAVHQIASYLRVFDRD
jgi:hypothetical protein